MLTQRGALAVLAMTGRTEFAVDRLGRGLGDVLVKILVRVGHFAGLKTLQVDRQCLGFFVGELVVRHDAFTGLETGRLHGLKEIGQVDVVVELAQQILAVLAMRRLEVERGIADGAQIRTEEAAHAVLLVAPQAAAAGEEFAAQLEGLSFRQALDMVAAQAVGLGQVAMKTEGLPELDFIGMRVLAIGRQPLAIVADGAAHLADVVCVEQPLGMVDQGGLGIGHAGILDAHVTRNAAVGAPEVRQHELPHLDLVALGRGPLFRGGGQLDQRFAVAHLVDAVLHEYRLTQTRKHHECHGCETGAEDQFLNISIVHLVIPDSANVMATVTATSRSPSWVRDG